MMIDVAIIFAGGSWYPISAKPDAMLSRLATMVIGLRATAPYIIVESDGTRR